MCDTKKCLKLQYVTIIEDFLGEICAKICFIV